MSNRKHRKEIDKAVTNLIKFSEQEPWLEWQEDFYDQVLGEVAEKAQVSIDSLGETLDEFGHMSMVMGYLFDLFATSQWNGADHTFIEEYLKRRGWRESPRAKKYLQALSDSEVQLWEVTGVSPGQWVDVRPLGEEKQTVRVFEQSGSESLKKWDCIAARVLSVYGQHCFGGAILPFSPDQAHELPALMERAYQSVVQSLKEIREEEADCDWSDEQIEESARTEAENIFPDMLCQLWTEITYRALTAPMPDLVNRDGHSIEWCKIQFPFQNERRSEIEALLDSTHELEQDEAGDWIWLSQKGEDNSEAQAIILGTVTIDQNHLLVSVNSYERSEQAKRLVREILGNCVGEPMTLHQDMPSMMQEFSDQAPSEELHAPELASAYLDQHYRQVLDEPVPALNDLTPRECSQKSDQRDLLIRWLKGLENSSAGSKGVPEYDFSWLWKELGLCDKRSE